MASLAVAIEQDYLTVDDFELESGIHLKDVTVAYKTWGKLSETRDNVMIICHAFTGSANVEDWCVFFDLTPLNADLILGGDLSWDRVEPLIPLDILYFVQMLWEVLMGLARLSL